MSEEAGQKIFTHRLWSKTDEAIRELDEDAVGHDVFDRANQLHPDCDL